MKFNSTSEAVRHYVKELLSDGEVHTTEEIRSFVTSKLYDNVTSGIFSGAIRDLINKEPQYVNVGRGQYRLIEDQSILVLSVQKSLENAISEIKQELDNISVSTLTEEEFDDVRNIQAILKGINKLKELI